MEAPQASLWLCLLLSQLSFCPTAADRDLSNTQWSSYQIENSSSAPATEPNLTTNNHMNSFDVDNNGTRIDCLIDTEMGLIAIGSAGGLIVCLLLSTVVLACQVCHLQRQVYAPRNSRSNMFLVSGTGYWDTDQPGVGGLVGPCDSSVMLEEVRADRKIEEEEAETRGEGAAAAHEEGTPLMAFASVGGAGPMQSSNSTDSCLEVPRDLEDMPLVV